MKTYLKIIVAFILSIFLSCSLSHAVEEVRSRVIVSEIRGTINPATADYLESSIARAQAENAQALIVELDTPGGLVSSVQAMAQTIEKSSIPVVVYVTPAGASATSAGALLMLASHVGVMAPGTHMGAAHPVDTSGKNIDGAMGKKVLNDTVSFAQGLAELRNRNRDQAGLIVSESKSFTSQAALDQHLIEIHSPNLESLLVSLNGRESLGKKMSTEGALIVKNEMSFGQKILHLLSNPNIAAILMTLAMLLIYVEIQSPGIQIAGILGVVFLIVGFMCFQTLPIRVGALALMGVGLVAMILEVVASAHGVLALGGVVSFILGMIWVVDSKQIAIGVSPQVWVPAAIALGSGSIAIGWFATRVKKQAREALVRMGGGGLSGLEGYVGVVENSGKILIRGELWDFDCESNEKVLAADHVEVTGLNGFKVRVKKKL
jgi:membrane-bound serine protease (ClpP class)